MLTIVDERRPDSGEGRQARPATPYDLQSICLRCHAGDVQIDWPASLGDWLDDLDASAGTGDDHAQQVFILAAAALKHLQDLTEPPTRDTETATLKWERQSRRNPIWRVSHAYREGVAVRLIGDVFYNSVGTRADALIDQWKREVERWEE